MMMSSSSIRVRAAASSRLRRVVASSSRHRRSRPLSSSAATVFEDDRYGDVSSSSSPHPRFPRTFAPLRVSPHLPPLPNRVIMGSMHCGLEPHSVPSWLSSLLGGGGSGSKGGDHHGPEALAAYYAERVRGGAAAIVTGGVAPNRAGWVGPFAAKLTTAEEVRVHRSVTDAVRREVGPQDVRSLLLLQILHAGRYAAHPFAVAPSPIRAPIGSFTPFELSTRGVRDTVRDFANCAALAREAGYDGVEIMGSEGYLIHQFLSLKTNRRRDEYGGEDFARRARFAVEIVDAVKRAAGDDFLLVYRLSMLDLMEEGDGTASWEEVRILARALEDAGVHVINTGVGWHEARIPTIATCVPRAAFVPSTTARLKREKVVDVPLVASNRINDPDTVERVLTPSDDERDNDDAPDLVSMARPFLADPAFVRRMFEATGAPDAPPLNVNTCIACNQACLDHVFVGRVASCLVNPRAGHELEFARKEAERVRVPRRLAVVGAGPAGLAFSLTAAELGHQVDLYDEASEIGGQFTMARRIPGKSEFDETLRYFREGLAAKGDRVRVHLNHRATAEELAEANYDRVVVATGVHPRTPPIPGAEDAPNLVSYVDVLRNDVEVGENVIIVGAGGIGFDVAEFLLERDDDDDDDDDKAASFFREWGVDPTNSRRGGLSSAEERRAASSEPPRRNITMLQRRPGKLGAGLGRTTGWIHRAALRRRGVRQVGGCRYVEIDERGRLRVETDGGSRTEVLEADTIVLCAGQEPRFELATELAERGYDRVSRIGGAWRAGELDAKRAIDMGVRLAYDADLDDPRIVDERDRTRGDEELLVDAVRRIVGN